MIKWAIKLKSKINIVSINLFVGCLIAACVLILSYAHTTALFERSGYRSLLAHLGVIGFEAAFVLGTVTLIWATLNGEKVRLSTRCVFGLGVLFNLYSNITSGIAKNGQPLVFYVWRGIVIDEAVLVGALIPLLIVAAELVISDAIVQYRRQRGKQRIGQTVERPKQTGKQSDGRPIKQTDKQTTDQTNRQSGEPSDSRTVEQTDQQSNKRTDKQSGKQTDCQTLETIALRLKEELGDWPSYRRLAKEANVTPYQAGQTIKRLKQRVS
ncbi:hypothetical protein [Lihuaxuella thermophila]|uniref:DUF2637 domain-containing protein n=1 Tax=Lihuaxuella thermophila TaxID=1173111 RepID=A0A1H8D8X9_9BACL|nr:hypothetical protein [Lihuaxuella thermophila]SEN02947.1 hypothetical protein SAMN05444955_10517 [Lihuaxuella thermophila]